MTGSFSPAARAAIYGVTDGRCAGCGRTSPLTCQHRRARGKGGTSLRAVGDAANGLPLCGSGTTGCHGWAEAHPTYAALLGWRLTSGQTVEDPFWTAQYGWRRYVADDGTLLHAYVDFDDLGELAAREAAVGAFRASIAG